MITEYNLPRGSTNPQGITAGPDGAIWFIEAYDDKIGRITTTGLITEYLAPSGNAGLVDITAGPDGALWFTEYVGGKIGASLRAK